jgi:hypothetical protein
VTEREQPVNCGHPPWSRLSQKGRENPGNDKVMLAAHKSCRKQVPLLTPSSQPNLLSGSESHSCVYAVGQHAHQEGEAGHAEMTATSERVNAVTNVCNTLEACVRV